MADTATLIAMLKSHDPADRGAACVYLRSARFIPTDAIPLLRGLLDDPVQQVAIAARRALDAHFPSDAVAPDVLQKPKSPEQPAVALHAPLPARQPRQVASQEGQPRSKAMSRLILGIIVFLGAGAITIMSYQTAAPGGSYVIFWGAMLWGFVAIIQGLSGLSRSPSADRQQTPPPGTPPPGAPHHPARMPQSVAPPRAAPKSMAPSSNAVATPWAPAEAALRGADLRGPSPPIGFVSRHRRALLVSAAIILILGGSYWAASALTAGQINTAYSRGDCVSVASLGDTAELLFKPLAGSIMPRIEECRHWIYADWQTTHQDWARAQETYVSYLEWYPEGILVDEAQLGAANALLQLGKSEVAAGNYENAAGHFAALIEAYGSSPDGQAARAELPQVYLDWARQLHDQQNYEQAALRYQTALEQAHAGALAQPLTEGLILTYLAWADDLGHRRDFAGAVEKYQAASALPMSAEQLRQATESLVAVRLSWAEQLQSGGDYDEAAQHLLEVLNDDPEPAFARDLHTRLAVVYAAKGDAKLAEASRLSRDVRGILAAALEAYQAALEHDPHMAAALEGERILRRLPSEGKVWVVQSGMSETITSTIALEDEVVVAPGWEIVHNDPSFSVSGVNAILESAKGTYETGLGISETYSSVDYAVKISVGPTLGSGVYPVTMTISLYTEASISLAHELIETHTVSFAVFVP